MRKWWRGLAPAVVVLLAALAVAGLRPATEHGQGRPPLRFGPGGVFRVALFADLHYGEDAWTDWGPAQDAASDRVMAAVLDAENPGRCLPMLCFPFQLFPPKELKRNSSVVGRSLPRRRNPCIFTQTSWCTSATS